MFYLWSTNPCGDRKLIDFADANIVWGNNYLIIYTQYNWNTLKRIQLEGHSCQKRIQKT